jgi:hypothetical protein
LPASGSVDKGQQRWLYRHFALALIACNRTDAQADQCNISMTEENPPQAA